MAPPIEDTLRPETLNEVLLIDRIHELHRLSYEARGTPLSYVSDPNDKEIELQYLAPTLRLAGVYQAEVEAPGSLRITARTHGPTKFGLANYVSAEMLQTMSPHAEASVFDHIWRDGMRSLAKELQRIQNQ